jgi:hypothetical protein
MKKTLSPRKRTKTKPARKLRLSAERITSDDLEKIVATIKAEPQLVIADRAANLCKYCLGVATGFLVLIVYKPAGFSIPDEISMKILQLFIGPVMIFVALRGQKFFR